MIVFATLAGLNANAQYCPSGATSTADEEIYAVTMNSITNAYSCTTIAPGPGSALNQYSNFTTLGNMWTFAPGATVNFNIQEDECDGPTYYAFGTAIWIDFNQNNSFADPGEKVFVENATLIGPRNVVNSFVIPSTAMTGQTRMRITVAEASSGTTLTECLSYGFGETEDYNILIQGPTGPTLPPIANFYAPDTVWINSPATLINTSSFQSRVFWNLPNENPLIAGYNRQAGYIDTAKYFNNFTYTFTSPGLKLVKLLAVNNLKRDSLRDSISKFIYVDTPSQKPKADFITFKRIMGITEEAPFIDLSTNGPTQWEWTIDPYCISCVTDPANGIANYFVKGNGIPGADAPNPRLAAFDAGVFKVCLRVWNLRGTDSICKTDYIKVVEGNYMCSGSGGFTSSKMEGFLYGINGPYQTYARSSWPSNCPGFTIAPCADSITLFVERIKMWPTDSIIIYNGPNNTSPILRTIGAGTSGQIPLTQTTFFG
ncbi:MAG: GEVED domain-containing protein, partial [Candidatus Methylacidiphilales bacterium]